MNNQSKTVDEVQEFLQNGQFDQAVGAAKEIVKKNPEDVFCLSIIAQSEFNTGDLEKAVSTLEKALAVEPTEINLNRNLGIIKNKLGKFSQSSKAFISAIENNLDHPGIMLDMLLLGISLDKISKELASRAIEYVFHRADNLKNAYRNPQELPFISEASKIANNITRNARHTKQKQAIDEISLGFDESKKKRLYDFLDSFHGIQVPKYADPMQKPTYHVFPDLEPLPFYDTRTFNWVEVLEENWLEIKDELNSLYNKKVSVKPYIENASTGNQELDVLADSLDWSSIHLIKSGEYNKKLLDKCPTTKAVLEQLPLSVLSGNGPEAFLSVLQPGAEIKPHYGLSNIKLTVHLGIEIPKNCAIRVGNETQEWQEGKVLIFDDSFEHEAWNHSEEERKVFILEIWHPDLSYLERQGIQKIMELQHGDSQLALAENIENMLSEIKQVI
jgi:aspartate beta-hydroxylase